MMRSLLTKELRGQWPMMVMIVCLITFTPIHHALKRSLNLMGMDEIYREYAFELGGEFLSILFLISMAVASGLIVREFDDSTIEFLDSLPISRPQSFRAKWLVGIFVLSWIPILVILFSVILLNIAKTSMEQTIHWDWLLIAFGLQMVSIYFCLSVSMAMSFLRRFGWLLAGVVITTLLAVEQISPTFRLSSFLVYPRSQFDGYRWIIPWRVIGFQCVMGTIGLFIAYFGYVFGGQTVLKWLGASTSRLKQVVLAGVSVLIVIVGLIGLSIQVLNDPELQEQQDPDGVRVVYPSWQTSSRSTHHFDAVYPRNMSRKANRLLDDADDIYETVASFLEFEVPVEGARVQLDLNGSSPYHLGTAYWKKLMMSLSSHESHADLRRTLGHETTHVVLETISEGELQKNFGSVRFFHEGVATYVEQRFFANPESPPSRLAAAVQHARGEVDFHLMIHNAQWCKKYDSLLVYSLGEVFAEAVVRHDGDGGLAKLARAFADKSITDGLSGSPLWRSVFQSAGMSLNEVVGEFYRVLDEAVDKHADVIKAFPDRQALVDMEGDELTFRLKPIDHPSIDETENAASRWDTIIRFRPSIHSPDTDVWTEKIQRGECTVVSQRHFEGSVVWYAIGYRKKGALPMMGRWQKVTLW